MGWELKEGKIESTDDDLLKVISNALTSKSYKKTSYKFALMKSILDNLFNANDKLEIGFDDLSYTFLHIFWNIISKYNLPQIVYGKNQEMSSIEKSIYILLEKNPLQKGLDFESLSNIVKSEYLNYNRKEVSKYVIGALYSEFNKQIFGFSKDENIIYFTKESYEILLYNKSIIEKINYYSWIMWIEDELNRRGISVGNIATKLDSSTKRKNLSKFKGLLTNMKDSNVCFYCGKSLKDDKIHVDHFIPWSFVKNDDIWNFVISCKGCNSSKNNHLASTIYFEKLLKRNSQENLKEFENNIINLYNAAVNNGLKKWINKI